MSDRILVMHRGRIQAEIDRADATEERVLSARALRTPGRELTRGRTGRRSRAQFGTLIGLVVLCAVLWILTPHFLTVSNLLNVAEQTSINAIVAVGMTFVILSGGIDLSVGSIVALSGVVLGTALQGGQPLASRCRSRWPPALACGLGERRADQLGRPAAVHRDARHDEHRARRGAAVHRRPAGLGIRRRRSACSRPAASGSFRRR